MNISTEMKTKVWSWNHRKRSQPQRRSHIIKLFSIQFDGTQYLTLNFTKYANYSKYSNYSDTRSSEKYSTATIYFKDQLAASGHKGIPKVFRISHPISQNNLNRNCSPKRQCEVLHKMYAAPTTGPLVLFNFTKNSSILFFTSSLF